MASGGPRGSFMDSLHGAEQEAHAAKCNRLWFG